MKSVYLALFFAPLLAAYAEQPAAPKTSDQVVAPPKAEEAATEALFARVREAHARAMQRGAIPSSAPRS